jgi:hypothetical protein
MNIAFPALLIFVLVLPGAIFRYTYARGSWGWSSPVSFRSVSDELAYSVIFAAGLHFLWLAIASRRGYQADFHSLLALLIGNFGSVGQRYESSLGSIASHPMEIGTYQLSLFAVAAIAGRLAHRFIRRTKLDLLTQIFRFKNEWYYLLRGEILSFRERTIAAREIDGVFLSAVVDHGKESYLYRGLVEDWSFDVNGELDTIRLRDAHRRLLSQDRTENDSVGPGHYVAADERYYALRGDLLFVRYSHVKTMNLDYFSLSEGVESKTPSSSGVIARPSRAAAILRRFAARLRWLSGTRIMRRDVAMKFDGGD